MIYNISRVVLMQLGKKFLWVLCKTSPRQTGKDRILSYPQSNFRENGGYGYL